MMQVKKKILFGLLALVMTVCVGAAVGLGASPARAEETAERKAIRMSIDMSHSDFQSTTFQGMNDTDYIAIMTTPFPVNNDGVGQYSFKGAGDYFPNWWDGIGDSLTVEYEYYLSTPIPGFGGIALSIDKAPWIYGHGPVDQDGRDAVDLDEPVELLQNGWRKRTVVYDTSTLPDAKSVFGDIYFMVAMQKGDLPESGTIDFYLRTMHVVYKSVRYALYDSTDANSFFIKACGSSFTSQYTESKPFRFAEGACDRFKECTGLAELAAVDSLHCGLSYSEVTCPDVTNIEKKDIPPALFVDSEYNLLDYVQATGGKTVSVSGVTKGGELVTVADPTKFTPQEAGIYTVTYTASADNTSTLKVDFLCEKNTKPVFVEADVVAAVPKTGAAPGAITLGSVLASVNGEKNHPTTVEVYKAPASGEPETGEKMTVTQTANGWSFEPTPKTVNDVIYYVRYKAENDGETTYSDWQTVTVTDSDKPVFDFSAMTDSVTVGTHYSVDELTDGLSITDISDGELTEYQFEITDPTGKNVEISDDGIFVTNSGKYTLNFTAKDSDDNSVKATAYIDAAAVDGCVIQATFNVAEENRAAGVRKFNRAQLFDLSPKAIMLVAGSQINYEVMAYTVIDGQIKFIPGVGAITAQLSPSWKFIDAVIGDAEDSDGNKMAATADLSQALQNNGKAVWLKRSYTVKKDDGLAGQQFYHFATIIDTTAACGEQIYVYYRNLELVSPDGESKTSLGSASDEMLDGWGDGDDMAENVTSHNLSATLDRYPVYIKDSIPTSADIGGTVKLTKYAMKDAYRDCYIEDLTYTVTDPSGESVQLIESVDSFSFVGSARGRYTVVCVGANDIGQTSVTVSVKVDDNVDPTVELTQFAPEKGKACTASFKVSDNITAAGDITVDGKVWFGTTAVEGAIWSGPDASGVVTVTFTPADEGEYRIILTATDGVGNETTKEFKATSGKDGNQGGDGKDDNGGKKKKCGGIVSGGGTWLSVLGSVAILAGMVLVRVKRKKTENK